MVYLAGDPQNVIMNAVHGYDSQTEDKDYNAEGEE